MQKAEKRVIPSHQVSHHLDRMAIPYLAFLTIFAVLPALVMLFLVFVDTEGIRFENMVATITNFEVLTERSTIIAFFNSVNEIGFLILNMILPSLVGTSVPDEFPSPTVIVIPLD